MNCPSCGFEGEPEKRVQLGGRGASRGSVRHNLVCRSCEEPWQGEMPAASHAESEPVRPVVALGFVHAPEAEPLAIPQQNRQQLPPLTFDPIAAITSRLEWLDSELARFSDLKAEQKRLRKMLAAGQSARRPKRSGATDS